MTCSESVSLGFSHFWVYQVTVKRIRDIMCWRLRPPMDPWRMYSSVMTSMRSRGASSLSFLSLTFLSLSYDIFLHLSSPLYNLSFPPLSFISPFFLSFFLSFAQGSSMAAKNRSSRRHPVSTSSATFERQHAACFEEVHKA